MLLLGEAAQGAALQGAADGDVALGRVDEERADDSRAGGREVVGRAEAVEGVRAAVADDEVGFGDGRVGEFEGVGGGGLEERVGRGAGAGEGLQEVVEALGVAVAVVGLDEPALAGLESLAGLAEGAGEGAVGFDFAAEDADKGGDGSFGEIKGAEVGSNRLVHGEVVGGADGDDD